MKITTILLAICLALSFKSHSQINFTEVQPSPFSSIRDGAIAFTDIDGDGDQDFLLTGNSVGTRTSKLYSNDGNGIFTEITTPFEGVQNSSVAFADIDGDADMDVVIMGLDTNAQPSVRMYTNDGIGAFIEVFSPFEEVYNGSISFEDVDGDSDQDFLISGIAGNIWILKLYLNDGNGNFTLSPNGTFTGVYFGSLEFADVDGDGDRDFLVTGITNNVHQARMYKNNGSGIFTLVANTPFVPVYRSTLAFADVDGDNDQDVVISGIIDGGGTFRTHLYINDGSGTFTDLGNVGLTEVADGSLAFADVDSDNDKDLLITGFAGQVGNVSLLYSNDGSGNFTEVGGLPFQGVSNSAVAFQDVDGDSDFDVVITGAFNGSTTFSKLYLNESVLGFADFNEESENSFFPNPANNFISFQHISEKSILEIFDVYGKKLLQMNIDSNSNSVNIESFSKGIYFVRINNRFAGKLLKI